MAASQKQRGGTAIVREEQLDEFLKSVQATAQGFKDLEVRTDEALYESLEAAYRWWEHASKHKAYLKRKCETNDPPIEMRGNTPRFTPVIKLVFGLHRDTHKANVSKYSVVLEVVAAEIAKNAKKYKEAGTIASFIKKSGGVQKLAATLNVAEAGPPENLPATERRRIDEELLKSGVQFYRTKPKLGEVKVSAARSSTDGFVLMLGRTNGNGTVEVLDVADAQPEQIQDCIRTSAKYEVGHLPPMMNFMAEILTLGKPVREPKGKQLLSRYPVNPNADAKAEHTEFKKKTRSLLFRNGKGVLLSEARADSGIAIRAKPKFDCNLGDRELYLRINDRQWFEENALDSSRRRLFEYSLQDSAPDEASERKIQLTNVVTGRARSLYFYDYAQRDPQIDIDDPLPQWQWRATVDADWLENEHNAYLKNYAALPKGGKASKIITITLSGNSWSMRFGDSPDFKMSVDTGIENGQQFVMNVFGDDWVNVVNAILSVRPKSKIEIKGEESGVISLGLSTDLADYSVFVPTVMDEANIRNPKFFRPYRT